MSDKNKKSPLVTGNNRKSADSLANDDSTLETEANLPQETDPTTAPIITGVDMNEPVDPNPTSLGETPSPTERSLRTEDKLRDSYGRPISSADVGSTGSSSYPRSSDRTTDIGATSTQSSSSSYQYGASGQSSSQDRTEQARQEAQKVRREAEQGAQQAKREAQQRARQAKRGFSKLLDEQPLVVGLAAALVGILVGLAFPATRRENEMMGEASDGAVQRAKEVAQRTFESAKETAKEEARSQGLTPESLKQEAKDKAQAAQDVAKKTAEEAEKTAKEESQKKS